MLLSRITSVFRRPHSLRGLSATPRARGPGFCGALAIVIIFSGLPIWPGTGSHQPFGHLFEIPGFIATAQAQEKAEPSLPESLQGLVSKGAQIKYLGRSYGLDGWIMVFKGQEQYFYVTPDGKAFVSGLLFSAKGDPLTLEQVRNLQESGNAQILNSLLSRQDKDTLASVTDPAQKELEALSTSPAERLYKDVKESNWISIGQQAAPEIYAFIDPTCPHCHAFLQEMYAGPVTQGLIELKVVPVSRFTDDDKNLQRAAYILASPEPEQDLMDFVNGDESALPADGGLNTQAVQQNMAVLQKWKLDSIPFIIYRAKGGDIKIVRGKVKNPGILLSDLEQVR